MYVRLKEVSVPRRGVCPKKRCLAQRGAHACWTRKDVLLGVASHAAVVRVLYYSPPRNKTTPLKTTALGAVMGERRLPLRQLKKKCDGIC